MTWFSVDTLDTPVTLIGEYNAKSCQREQLAEPRVSKGIAIFKTRIPHA